MNGFRDCINKMLDEKDEASLGNILNLFNKALRSHIFVCNVRVYSLPNGWTEWADIFLREPLSTPGVT